MIVGQFHEGSGIGNQLHRYVMTRVLAKDKGVDFAMVGEFKGKEWMNLDTGVDSNIIYDVESPSGKLILSTNLDLWEEGTKYYNPEINFVEDNTIIDGEFQDLRYFRHRINQVQDWLVVEYLPIPDDVCVIGFRGGEYVGVPELFLTKDYWDSAIAMMREINPDMKFEVHTDDERTAKAFFPDFPVIQDAGTNWRAVRQAKYLIIANSSFYILPSLLNDRAKKIIAPRGWARHNLHDGTWSTAQNYYPKFTYI